MKADSGHNRLRKLQKKIYQALKSESLRLIGEAPASIKTYEREFERDFKNIATRPKALDKGELIDEIRRTQVTFISDYHTFEQAQRTALRIIRSAIRPEENWRIGLEMIPSHHQSSLDAFQKGEIGVEEFLAKMNYSEEWGFSWENYAPLFQWAKENEIPLVALNLPREFRAGARSDLEERDRWAAGIITDLFASAPRMRMIVLYGELHVGREHLPKQLHHVSKSYLSRPLRSITIHQNHESLYWKLAHEGREHKTEILRLKRHTFCVFSSTPWAKLQSLVTWTENEMAHPYPRISQLSPGAQSPAPQSRAELDDDAIELWGDSGYLVDHLSTIQSHGNTIAEFLGVKTPNFEDLHAFTIGNADFVHELDRTDLFSKSELALIRYHVLHHQRIYIPKAKIAYLATPSENAIAEMAAIHLLSDHKATLVGSGKIFDASFTGFQKLVLQSAFGFLGSLILNPRRKCDLLEDHRARVAGLRQGDRPMFPHELEARRVVIALLGGSPALLQSILKTRRLAPAVLFAGRYLGQILARGLHHVLINDQMASDEMRSIFVVAPRDFMNLEETIARQYEALWKIFRQSKSDIGRSKADQL